MHVLVSLGLRAEDASHRECCHADGDPRGATESRGDEEEEGKGRRKGDEKKSLFSRSKSRK